ncbi:MAG: LuxR C-terminal-related transcriptional regulator [Inquilinus sp.]|uniref:LuxR C-terminal-related transcriptional regulator n=1 Tax=Inquilinus sp. TaxID=1932117 RepID=UPI003F3BA760
MFAYRGNYSAEAGQPEQDTAIGLRQKAEGSGGPAAASIDAQEPPRPNHDAPLISIIDPRTLGRDILTRALQAVDGTFRIRAYAGVEEWLQGEDIEHETSAILLGIGAAGADDPDVVDQLQRLARTYAHIPTVVMGDIEDPLHIVKVLGYGARGYIPTSVNLNVVVGAISLARAGGLFVPASSLTAFQPTNEAAVTSPLRGLLSARQAAVADAISRGKPNKIIAYELNLCESTVKVHIRGIMKKLQARNRTEVAFKMHNLAKRPTGARPGWSTEMRA